MHVFLSLILLLLIATCAVTLLATRAKVRALKQAIAAKAKADATMLCADELVAVKKVEQAL